MHKMKRVILTPNIMESDFSVLKYFRNTMTEIANLFDNKQHCVF